MKHYLYLLGCLFSMISYAQNVYIPDAVLKANLVANTTLNTNSDGEIQVSEAQAYGGTLDISNKSIADITGLEAFINISTLYAQNCDITTADFSSNTNLIWITIAGNPLTSLNLSGNINLQTLVVSQVPLATVDISANVNLTTFYAYWGDLQYMDFSNNTQLKDVKLWKSMVDSIDLSYCPNLTKIDVNGCQLRYLNVKNGANNNLTFFKASGNPDLYCIEVDDTVYSNANWGTGVFAKDAQTFYSEDCALALHSDELNKDMISVYPNPTTGTVIINGAHQSLNVYDVHGRLVKRFPTTLNTYHLKELGQGVFLILIDTEDGLIRERLIIE